MGFRFRKRVKTDLSQGESPVYTPLPLLIGLSEFSGALSKGDVVSVVVEATTPVSACFSVFSFLVPDLDDRSEVWCNRSGRYYPREEHLFRVVKEPKSVHEVLEVEPVFFDKQRGVVHHAVNERFRRCLNIPLEVCDFDEVIPLVLGGASHHPIDVPKDETQQRLIAIGEPPQLGSLNIRKLRQFMEKIEQRVPLRTRTPPVTTTARPNEPVSDALPQGIREAAPRMNDLKRSLRAVMPYVDYREVYFSHRDVDALRDYLPFMHAHKSDIVYCLDLDEDAGELEALLRWAGTVEQVVHRKEVDYPRLVRHALGNSETIAEQASFSLWEPAHVAPSRLPVQLTQIKHKFIHRVLRTDPKNEWRVPPVVTDWGATVLDVRVMDMLDVGCVVRATSSEGDPQFSKDYYRLLVQLDDDHFLAIIEQPSDPRREEALIVIPKLAMQEIPLRHCGNYIVYSRYQRMLRRMKREKEAVLSGEQSSAQGDVVGAIGKDDLDELASLESHSDVDESELELMVGDRPSAGTGLPISYERLLPHLVSLSDTHAA